MNLFSLSLKLNRFPISKAQKTLREIKDIPESEYGDYVEQKKEEILKYHLKHNPFYQEFAGKRAFANWQEVPLMKKADLQRPLKDRISKAFSLKKVHISKTSGSSGQPFVFAKDRFCHALTWAIFIDRYRWFGIDLDKSLQARFYGIPLDKFGYLKERIKDRMGYRRRFPIFNLDEEKMEDFLSGFRKKPFDYINGYTSSIVLFAKFLQRKNIILKEECPSLKLCIVTSEMFFAEDRKLLESQFGIPVVNEYGASELGLLSFENPEREWIFNSESMFLEIVNEKGELLPPGEEGHIVITSLYNKAHPFIRYDIGDWGSLDPSSTLKKPILKRLVGRTNDVALLPSGKVVPGLTFYYVTKSIIEDDGRVKEFVIRQTEPRKFSIIYVSELPLPGEKLKDINKAMDQYLERGLELNFEHVTSLNRSKRGKLKQFESML